MTNVGFDKVSSRIGLRYVTLNYIIKHYEKYHPNSFEKRALKILKAISPKKIFIYPLPFPSEMVFFAKKK